MEGEAREQIFEEKAQVNNWTEADVAAHQKRVKGGAKRDSAGMIPRRRASPFLKEPKKPNPLERARVLEILQWLQANHPKFCWVRVEPSSAVRARVYAGQPDKARKFPEDAWGDGVADIFGFRKWFPEFDGIMIEVKRPGQKQRPSQVTFQARWEAAGGLYMVANDSKQVEEQFKVWGI